MDAQLNQTLKQELDQYWKSGSSYLRTRRSLPAANMRDKVVELMEKNQVLVISGETGCGKSTQVTT